MARAIYPSADRRSPSDHSAHVVCGHIYVAVARILSSDNEPDQSDRPSVDQFGDHDVFVTQINTNETSAR